MDEQILPETARWKADNNNPYNWSPAKKNWVFFVLMMIILSSSLGSSLPSNAIPFIAEDFGVGSQSEKTLPMSCYLIGYVFGPLVWAPTSEQRGRRNIAIGTFILFTVFIMACALSNSWSAFLVFRLLAGIFASGPIAVATGVLADIYQDPRIRGRSVALYLVVTSFGPLLGPIVSGFASPTLGWRWSFWIGLILAGVTLTLLISLPETHGALLRAAKSSHHDSVPPNRPDRDSSKYISTVLLRPLHMLFFEPIVSASSAYLALCYSIFYMSFEAYPIIFQNIYGMSPGICGLTYLPIGAGCILFLPIFWLYDSYMVRLELQQKAWFLKKKREYLRLPLACLGGPLFAGSLIWLGWSARTDVSFVVPLMAGVPFGFGFICIFIALVNHLTDAYEIYSASANAASSCSRSLLATVLPLATRPMFDNLGVDGACSLLGGLSALMCVIPFVFIWKGDAIRRRSGFCNMLEKTDNGDEVGESEEV
ncbi:MFS general substrate transporter [Aspergillus sclerotioniger CBS 115572]|uniref:MFS general substrate transporter n=1 Tax=Aspergillus sclerotioniger CBS 115572 TaxID=1450535 RepID=A0A317WNL4_9EURO|nr:MFS general substrate transporter [Aspergillus sclerotioniger CBS 115572]PWY87963.1 MFS general substrate transporter [Aspergillus sclerotioniger CBS 115572]